MVDENTDFLKIVDNFAKTAHVPSIPIIESKLNFVSKVTIAIPTYKRADFLKDAVDSAIAQIDYDNFDIIIVDNDPERDSVTEKLMLSYLNPKLSYYKNEENIQMAGNWNRCFELAKGEFVVMLHDDDLLLPTFISECMDIINKKSNIGILKPLPYVCKNNEYFLKIINIEEKKIYKLQRLYDFSNHDAFILGAPSGCLFKKEEVIKLGGFNQEHFPILDFCFAVIFSQKNEVYNYNKKLSVYRISVNESLKLSTLINSFEGTYFIRRQILHKYKIPYYIIKQYLSCSLTVSIKSYKSLNSDFDYDIRKLGLRHPTRIKIIIYKISLRLINSLLIFFTTEKVLHD